MALIFVSYLAGVLTVLAPCTLPILPLIIGGSVAEKGTQRRKTLQRALLIVGSLALSVFIFTLLLKATTSLLGVPQIVWKLIAGGIVLLLGIHYLFPGIWLKISMIFGFQASTNKQLTSAGHKPGTLGAVLTGAALGPVFSSCSPTYALIIATVLPASFATGIVYLTAYVAGMATLLLVVAYYGSRFVHKLGWALDEKGTFRRVIGVLFVLIGVAVITGFDKFIETSLLEAGFYDGTSGLETYFSR